MRGKGHVLPVFPSRCGCSEPLGWSLLLSQGSESPWREAVGSRGIAGHSCSLWSVLSLVQQQQQQCAGCVSAQRGQDRCVLVLCESVRAEVLQETMGLCSIRVQSCFQELTAAPPWRHQEGLGAEGSEQPMVCQELHRHQPRARLVALGLLGAHQLPQHPLTWGTAAIMCTLPLSPENHRVQLQLVGIERPPTKHRSVDPGWSSFIHPGMLVSSIPVPEAVPALPSLLCDLQHLPCESRQTPVFSHMETPPTLTDKSPLPGFVPTQLHCAALWQSKITRCVSPAAPVTPRGTELVAPTLPSPTMSCALCKGVRPIPRAKPVPPGTL